jgi:hypothetical protein
MPTEPFCRPGRVASASGLNASDQHPSQARSGLSDNARRRYARHGIDSMHALFRAEVQWNIEGQRRPLRRQRGLQIIQRIARQFVIERLVNAVDMVVMRTVREGQKLAFEFGQERRALRKKHLARIELLEASSSWKETL